MNDISNFYDELDLKYNEIGIAMQDIDRTNPGVVKFCIPVLTPDMNSDKIVEQTIHQDSSNLKNKEKKIEIENISITNYINIPVPKELCAFVGGKFEVLKGSILSVSDASSYIGIDAVMEGYGTINTLIGYINIYNKSHVSGNLDFSNGATIGLLDLMPVDRYIKEGSKWVISFIGGDITKPRVISRYLDDDYYDEKNK